MAYTSSKTDWTSNDGVTYTNMNRIEENVRSIYTAAATLVDDGFLPWTQQLESNEALTLIYIGFSSTTEGSGIFLRTDQQSILLDGGPGSVSVWIAHIFLSAVSGTSNNTAFTLSGTIASKYRPNSSKWIHTTVTDNGTQYPGALKIGSDGSIDVYRLSSGTYTNTWTATGTKGFAEVDFFTYAI